MVLSGVSLGLLLQLMSIFVCVFRLQMMNQGKVKFDYFFQVLMDSTAKTAVLDRDGKYTALTCGLTAIGSDGKSIHKLFFFVNAC